jgi:hypothetical protein
MNAQSVVAKVWNFAHVREVSENQKLCLTPPPNHP